jgi:hypothetical protein
MAAGTAAIALTIYVLARERQGPVDAASVDRVRDVLIPDDRSTDRAGAFHEWDTDPTTLGTAVALALLRQGARELIDAIPH